MHPDQIYNARDDARDELIRNVKEAAKLQRMLTAFNVDLMREKIVGIKALRERLGIGLKDAKDAWELAYELRAA
jgi:ribosomal protein L7/L12